MLTRLGVAGWPVGHSLSPAMHNAALAACGLSHWRYSLLPLPPELFAETVRALERGGFRGINVTVPHKEAALALADEADETALAVGAANTLSFAAGRIAATNTDATGLAGLLHGRAQGREALVLGAGGSARAAVWALNRCGAQVSVWNRTPQRAESLARELGAQAVRRPKGAEILVNCTTFGLSADAASLKQRPELVDIWDTGNLVVDLVYRNDGTELSKMARRRGADVIDGKEILVAQGAGSFEAWTGRTAPVKAMREAVTHSRPT